LIFAFSGRNKITCVSGLNGIIQILFYNVLLNDLPLGVEVGTDLEPLLI
jgi:hypothetical protein